MPRNCLFFDKYHLMGCPKTYLINAKQISKMFSISYYLTNY